MTETERIDRILNIMDNIDYNDTEITNKCGFLQQCSHLGTYMFFRAYKYPENEINRIKGQVYEEFSTLPPHLRELRLSCLERIFIPIQLHT